MTYQNMVIKFGKNNFLIYIYLIILIYIYIYNINSTNLIKSKILLINEFYVSFFILQEFFLI